MPTKRFDLVKPTTDTDPIGFFLGEHPFTCLSDLPVAATHALVSYASPVRGAFAFLRGALIAEDEDRFDEVVASKTELVTEEVLMDVLRYVSSEFGARPTRRSASSQAGPLTTSDGSPDSSSSEEPAPQ